MLKTSDRTRFREGGTSDKNGLERSPNEEVLIPLSNGVSGSYRDLPFSIRKEFRKRLKSICRLEN
jgi:hypothetical protein